MRDHGRRNREPLLAVQPQDATQAVSGFLRDGTLVVATDVRPLQEDYPDGEHSGRDERHVCGLGEGATARAFGRADPAGADAPQHGPVHCMGVVPHQGDASGREHRGGPVGPLDFKRRGVSGSHPEGAGVCVAVGQAAHAGHQAEPSGDGLRLYPDRRAGRRELLQGEDVYGEARTGAGEGVRGERGVLLELGLVHVEREHHHPGRRAAAARTGREAGAGREVVWHAGGEAVYRGEFPDCLYS